MNFFRSNILENLRMGLDTLWQHKLRSLLTILGVVIGTMTVIVIAAFVSGIDARVQKEIESFGTNSIYVYRFDPGFNFNPTQEERMRKPLSYEDTLAIESECPSILIIWPRGFEVGNNLSATSAPRNVTLRLVSSSV